jgi:NAD(P)-dependent dehydrogenase (short-subunit alcohol dehydrogenase family)
MTKAAIAHLTRCLAVEWGTHGARVPITFPFWPRTAGTTRLREVPKAHSSAR